MCKLYYGDKIIIFTDSEMAGCELIWRPEKGEKIGIAKMLEKLENNKCLCVLTDRPEDSYNIFCTQFRQVEAAGGVVVNEKNEMLMIYRNGRWDLPKGHIEIGETPESAAIREVYEETGLCETKHDKLITVTHHFYKLQDIWTLKHTWWYSMSCPGGDPVPQTAEGITKVEWVDADRASQYFGSCFASVQDVLSKHK